MFPDFTVGFLQDLLKKAQIPGPPKDETYESTVVFLLTYSKGKQPFILSILKADNQGYPWRNQVALPGGHMDKNDRSALEAAYRELNEEVGIFRSEVSYIGSLGHFQTIAHKDIEVFLGLWNGNEKSLKYESREISKIIQLPVFDLLKIHMNSHFFRQEPDITTLIYPVQENIIWGVTARILHFFFEMILNTTDISSTNGLPFSVENA